MIFIMVSLLVQPANIVRFLKAARVPIVAFFPIVAVSIGPSRASAEPIRELPVAPVADATVTLVAWGSVVGLELAKPTLAPRACVWCDRHLNSIDDSIRNALVRTNTDAPDAISSVAAAAVAPLMNGGFLALAANDERAIKNAPSDLLIVAEAAGVATLLNEGAKFAFGRERPFVRALAENEKANTPIPSDNNLSFYSGHTNLTFSLAVASGTVASMRGYRLAPLIWASGLTVGAVTGYLRIAADKHYFTDVVTGAAMGSAAGFLVPYLFHRPSNASALPTVVVAPVQSGGMMIFASTTL